MNYPQTYAPATNAFDQSRSALSVAQSAPANAFGGYQPQGGYGQENLFAGMNSGMSDGNYGSQAFGQYGGDTAFGNTDQAGLGMPGMDQIGAGAGIAKDLYGMYAAHQGMGLAKDQLGLQKQAFQSNVDNRNRFVGDTKAAFA